MYTNIPTNSINDIITEILLKQYIKIEITNEINLIINTILDQNYFRYNNQFFQQLEGLPLGAPTSSILSEIYLQHLEHNNIINILSKFHIINYNRYVDDIFILYDKNTTNIQDVINEFNKLHKNLQFTIEKENNKKLNFLDISITRKDKELEFNIYIYIYIYRKPTTTSTVIHASSWHPIEHKNKKVAFNYLLNRTEKYPLSKQNKETELNIIKQIAQENGYKNSFLNRNKHKTHSKTENVEGKKWVSFTYSGKEIRYIT
jgi:hypothetical protein